MRTPVQAAFAAAILSNAGSLVAQPLPDAEREVLAYSFRNSASDVETSGRPLLREPAVDRRTRSIPVDAFPEALRTRQPQVDIHTNMVVTLDAQGSPKDCRPTVLFSFAAGKRIDEPLEGSIGQELCALATDRLAYFPALDADGVHVASQVAVAILFRQERMAPPAPMPPASWIAQKDGFPPRYFDPSHYRSLTFTVPDGKRFAPSNRKDQRKLSADLLLSSNPGGEVIDCRVAVSSGSQAYDDASCAAARTMRTGAGGRSFAIRDYPLRMKWNKRAIELVTPVEARGPQLMAQPVIDPAIVEGMDLPKWTATSVELTVSPEGRLTGCQLSSPSYIDALDIASCRVFGAETRFTRPSGIFGDPAEGKLRMRIDWNALTMRRDGY